MKTSRLLIITAAIIACAAPAASARPAMDPSTARPHKEQASNMASIAAHKEQLSSQQYLASHGQTAESVPLTDGTDTDGQFPIVFVLVGLTLPLALGLAWMVSKPIRTHTRHPRPPASVA
jgi:hypothetical protein